MSETAEIKPLPIAASFIFSVAGFSDVHVYAYDSKRWLLIADGVEYYLFDEPEGLRLIENPF